MHKYQQKKSAKEIFVSSAKTEKKETKLLRIDNESFKELKILLGSLEKGLRWKHYLQESNSYFVFFRIFLSFLNPSANFKKTNIVVCWHSEIFSNGKKWKEKEEFDWRCLKRHWHPSRKNQPSSFNYKLQFLLALSDQSLIKAEPERPFICEISFHCWLQTVMMNKQRPAKIANREMDNDRLKRNWNQVERLLKFKRKKSFVNIERWLTF